MYLVKTGIYFSTWVRLTEQINDSFQSHGENTPFVTPGPGIFIKTKTKDKNSN